MNTLSQSRPEKQPTQDERAAAAAMLRMIWGLHISRAVYLAAELGIADLLAAGPRTAAALARTTEADQAALYRVLRLLAALGVLTEPEPGSFGLTVLGDRLRSDAPASVRYWAMLADTVGFGAHEPIVETVTTGQTGTEIAYGMTTMQRVRADTQRAARFDAAMSERTAAFAPSLAACYDFSGLRVIADIGGGQGTLLAAILRRHPVRRRRRVAPRRPRAPGGWRGRPLRDHHRGLLRGCPGRR